MHFLHVGKSQSDITDLIKSDKKLQFQLCCMPCVYSLSDKVDVNFDMFGKFRALEKLTVLAEWRR